MPLARFCRRRSGASPGRRRTILLLSLMSLACQGHPTASDRARSSIAVEAPSEESRHAVLTAAARIIPELEEEFGVRSPHLTIVVDLSSATETRGGLTSSEGITLFPPSVPWLSGVLAHEAVHWILHWQDSHWNTLPIVIEEGLAQIAFHKYSATEVSLDEAVLDAASALSMSHEEYNGLENRRAATYTGVFMAQRLGVDRLRGLALHADEAGEETIPSQWIIDALVEAWEADGRPSCPASRWHAAPGREPEVVGDVHRVCPSTRPRE